MDARWFYLAVSIGLLGLTSEHATAQAPPPLPASPTLWSFLGIPQAGYKLHAQLFNRRGNHPRLEKKPPLKGIADPANLKSDVPAIKAAAEIKQAEDLKPQKIKAIKYLATIGCGCYDKDEKVTGALLAAMDDCTEDVRLAAVEAIGTAAESEYCSQCKQRSCCNEKIVAQLSKIAYDRDDEGCFIEPSERVREAAIEAMGICCADYAAPIEPPIPVEGSDRPPVIEGGDAPARTPEPPQPPNDAPAPGPTTLDNQHMRPDSKIHQFTSSRRRSPAPTNLAGQHESIGTVNEDDAPPPLNVDAHVTDMKPIAETDWSSENQSIAPTYKKVTGSVGNVNLQAGLVQLHVHNGETMPLGATVKVYHQFLSGTSAVAVLKVIDSRPGEADARPISTTRAPKIARGDSFDGWR